MSRLGRMSCFVVAVAFSASVMAPAAQAEPPGVEQWAASTVPLVSAWAQTTVGQPLMATIVDTVQPVGQPPIILEDSRVYFDPSGSSWWKTRQNHDSEEQWSYPYEGDVACGPLTGTSPSCWTDDIYNPVWGPSPTVDFYVSDPPLEAGSTPGDAHARYAGYLVHGGYLCVNDPWRSVVVVAPDGTSVTGKLQAVYSPGSYHSECAVAVSGSTLTYSVDAYQSDGRHDTHQVTIAPTTPRTVWVPTVAGCTSGKGKVSKLERRVSAMAHPSVAARKSVAAARRAAVTACTPAVTPVP